LGLGKTENSENVAEVWRDVMFNIKTKTRLARSASFGPHIPPQEHSPSPGKKERKKSRSASVGNEDQPEGPNGGSSEVAILQIRLNRMEKMIDQLKVRFFRFSFFFVFFCFLKTTQTGIADGGCRRAGERAHLE
jgi:hypothetical protein